MPNQNDVRENGQNFEILRVREMIVGSVGGIFISLSRLNGSLRRYVGLFECGAVSFLSFLFVSVRVRRKRRLGIHLDSIRLDPSARCGGREGGVNDLVNFSEI